jgi:hypothetical protein
MWNAGPEPVFEALCPIVYHAFRYDDLSNMMRIISSVILLFALAWATPSAIAATYPAYTHYRASWGSSTTPVQSTTAAACNDWATLANTDPAFQILAPGTFTAFPYPNGAAACYTYRNGYYYTEVYLIIVNNSCNAGDPPPINGVCGCPDGQRYDANAKQCVPAVCPVSPITPITDPDFEQYETGRYSDDGDPDLEHLTPGTAAGAQCIVREAHNARIEATITSGYRPAIYQTHIREVYDKWQLLKDNQDPVCAEVKAQVLIEWDRHGPFAAQPGRTSRHSDGRAVDISLSNYGMADTIAARCQMWRRLPNDAPHFEPLR